MIHGFLFSEAGYQGFALAANFSVLGAAMAAALPWLLFTSTILCAVVVFAIDAERSHKYLRSLRRGGELELAPPKSFTSEVSFSKYLLMLTAIIPIAIYAVFYNLFHSLKRVISS